MFRSNRFHRSIHRGKTRLSQSNVTLSWLSDATNSGTTKRGSASTAPRIRDHHSNPRSEERAAKVDEFVGRKPRRACRNWRYRIQCHPVVPTLWGHASNSRRGSRGNEVGLAALDEGHPRLSAVRAIEAEDLSTVLKVHSSH